MQCMGGFRCICIQKPTYACEWQTHNMSCIWYTSIIYEDNRWYINSDSEDILILDTKLIKCDCYVVVKRILSQFIIINL